SPMRLDVMLSDSVVGAAERARTLEDIGVDGVFTFENAHDLFFPLVAAAPVCNLDLSTNVAIAFPRSPMHLANAAYDLHWLSGGRGRHPGDAVQLRAPRPPTHVAGDRARPRDERSRARRPRADVRGDRRGGP